MDIRLPANVSTTPTEYGVVLLNERTGDYFQLNPSAAIALRHLLDGCVPPQAAAALVQEFDVGPAQAERDVLALIDELRAAGLIKVSP